MFSIDSARTFSDDQGTTMSSSSQPVAGMEPELDVVEDSGLRLYVDIEQVRKECKIPDRVSIVGYPIDSDYVSGEGVGEGEALFTVSQLKTFRFPLPFLFSFILHTLGLSPLQMNPNFFRIVSCMVTLNRVHNLHLTIDDLLFCYSVHKVRSDKHRYHLFPCDGNRKLCYDLPSSDRSWKEKIVLVKGDWNVKAAQRFPIPRFFGKAKIPKTVLSSKF